MPWGANLPVEHAARACRAVVAKRDDVGARPDVSGRPTQRVRHGAGLPPAPPPSSGGAQRRRRASGTALLIAEAVRLNCIAPSALLSILISQSRIKIEERGTQKNCVCYLSFFSRRAYHFFCSFLDFVKRHTEERSWCTHQQYVQPQ